MSIVKKFGVRLIAVLVLAAALFTTALPAPALASVEEQVKPLIEEVESLQAKGREMESLRTSTGDISKLSQCGASMRRFQSQAASLSDRIESLKSTSIPATFPLAAAAGRLNLCVSCLPSALEYCSLMDFDIQATKEALKSDY